MQPLLRMSIGTKNRLQQTATTCKQHLRATFADQGDLVNEFIAEIEGSAADPASWSQFTDLKRSQGDLIANVEAAFREWLG
jgi:hypothetical protein